MNVQHAQTLVFLFHCLPMMQKKTFLVRVSLLLPQLVTSHRERDATMTTLRKASPLGLTRIVLLVDYFLHHFYDPPATLMDQVQWNLLQVFAQPREGGSDVKLKYCAFTPSGSSKVINDGKGKMENVFSWQCLLY